LTRYKIGEIARLLGLTTQALRFYEQEGVIVPQKSENGTRYYTSSDIIRLLAFKKYQFSEFSVQDVALHFMQGSLDSLITQLDTKSDALIAQSEALLRRARAIRSFERQLREAQAHEGEILCAETADAYLYAPTFDELNVLDKHQMETFVAFAGAMPDTSMCFTCPTDLSAAPEFRFGVSRQAAETWMLPLDHAMHIPPFRCVRIYVRAAVQPWNQAYMESIIRRVCDAGYTVSHDRPILGYHLASETIDGVVYLYGAFCIPVDESA